MKITGEFVKIISAKDLFPEKSDLSFVQAPKAIYFESKVRIYFTSRLISSSGHPQSDIYYIDFSENFEKLLFSNLIPILPLGDLGEFNEHGNAYFFPFTDESCYYGLFSGLSRRENTGIETAIGISYSNSNLTSFTKLGPGPLISTSLNQPMLIGNPFLFKYNGIYYMFYIYGERWIKNAEDDGRHSRVYKIGLKKGNSILELYETHNSIIENILGSNECQATPCVFESNGQFHMIFCYRNHTNFRNDNRNSYKLGYAFSDNLINWTRSDDKLVINSFGKWESEMKCYPSIVKIKDTIYLLYNGNDFGKYAFGIYKLKF